MYNNSLTLKNITFLKEENLIIHSWIPNIIENVIIYIHGLQSHASWSWELALDFVDKNTAFFCLDRPGSGLTSNPHDEFASKECIISAYTSFFKYIYSLYPLVNKVAIGHCLGGSILTAILAKNPDLKKGLVGISIISSWLGKMNSTLSGKDIKNILEDDSDILWSVQLLPEQFSSHDKYKNFIKNDSIAVRNIKRKSRKNIFAIEGLYINKNKIHSDINSQYILSYHDPIINRELATNEYIKYYGEKGCLHYLGITDHYIPFTDYRNYLVNLIMNMFNFTKAVI